MKFQPEGLYAGSHEINDSLIERSLVDMRNILERIDFDLLNDIFNNVTRGINVEHKALSLEDFVLEKGYPTDRDNKGLYDPRTGKIKLFAYGFVEEHGKLSSIEVFRSSIHEGTHKLARTRYRSSFQQEGGYLKVSIDPYGTEKEIERAIKKGNMPRHHIFLMLNEAVTEKIAREVLVEYLMRSHEFADSKEADIYSHKLKEVSPDFENYSNYEPEVFVLESMIEKISKEMGIDETAIWEAFKRGYFEEGPSLFEDKEVARGFEEVFSKDFLDNLSKYGYTSACDLVIPDKATRAVHKAVSGVNPLFDILKKPIYWKAFSVEFKSWLRKKFFPSSLDY